MPDFLDLQAVKQGVNHRVQVTKVAVNDPAMKTGNVDPIATAMASSKENGRQITRAKCQFPKVECYIRGS